jgi:superfamily II DNA helicase RecQ
MPQAEAAAAAAAKAREDELTAKRKKAAEGGARKRKEAAAAAPPPSAHQTDADELSIAQRRKLERPKEAPAKASAPSPASAGAKEHFGFNSLKYAQEVGLKVVLDTAQKQRHLLFILPTGGGKSLIYQL